MERTKDINLRQKNDLIEKKLYKSPEIKKLGKVKQITMGFKNKPGDDGSNCGDFSCAS